MISSQPALIPQEKGKLTRPRIWACTVFVDHYTGFVFVALMRDLTTELTLAAKKEFEHRCVVRGVKVKHYHADNGRFAKPAFVQECNAITKISHSVEWARITRTVFQREKSRMLL